ncbi:MAG: type III pantothenate kinase [Erysipelotrichaceae bacterium]|nr:type III pantothenate kinase [Erysipelotrichaceae bacterium]MDD3924317.1 type III pantothenate kinase [Erysipelotrichaceae bacterium]MDD4642247.1 type III pantothenate kinase [Erysipelotrichaceae bacterium]
MILIVDAGNTNVSIALYKEDHIIFKDRCETIKKPDNDYYQAFFDRVYKQHPKIKGLVISSVVPVITDTLFKILQSSYYIKPLIVNSELVEDLKIDLKDRNELGADLIATTFGAFRKYQPPIIVVDLGTATKISVLDEFMSFKGGLIIPGISIAQKATEMMIPHLPKIELDLPKKIITDDTIASMQAGLLYGTIYQVQGLCEAIEEELNVKATKIITGGYSRYIKEKMSDYHYEEDLLMDGLLMIYHKYHKQ